MVLPDGWRLRDEDRLVFVLRPIKFLDGVPELGFPEQAARHEIARLHNLHRLDRERLSAAAAARGVAENGHTLGAICDRDTNPTPLRPGVGTADAGPRKVDDRGGVLTYAIKVTVSVLYWYDHLHG